MYAFLTTMLLLSVNSVFIIYYNIIFHIKDNFKSLNAILLHLFEVKIVLI